VANICNNIVNISFDGLYLFVSSVVNKNVFKFVFGTSGVEENFSLGMDISCWIWQISAIISSTYHLKSNMKYPFLN